MSISTFKLGNRAQYEGPHEGFRGKQGTIISIDEMNGEDTYLIKVDNPNEQHGDVVRTYPSDIRPVSVTDGFLKQHGYSYDEKTKIFHGRPMDIVRLRIVRDAKDWRGNDSHMLDDMGYLAINSPVLDWSNEEEIQAKTTSVHHVHELQNYLEEIHKMKLEA